MPIIQECKELAVIGENVSLLLSCYFMPSETEIQILVFKHVGVCFEFSTFQYTDGLQSWSDLAAPMDFFGAWVLCMFEKFGLW